MSDATVGGRRVVTWSPRTLDRAFVAAYAVALAGNLAVSVLTYVYVGPAVDGVREANPVTAAVIGSLGLEWMVWVRATLLVGSYRAYGYVRARTSWSVLPVVFAWAGAVVQVLNLIADLRVAAKAGAPPGSALLAAGLVLAPALLVGIVLRPRLPS